MKCNISMKLYIKQYEKAQNIKRVNRGKILSIVNVPEERFLYGHHIILVTYYNAVSSSCLTKICRVIQFESLVYMQYFFSF